MTSRRQCCSCQEDQCLGRLCRIKVVSVQRSCWTQEQRHRTRRRRRRCWVRRRLVVDVVLPTSSDVLLPQQLNAARCCCWWRPMVTKSAVEEYRLLPVPAWCMLFVLSPVYVVDVPLDCCRSPRLRRRCSTRSLSSRLVIECWLPSLRSWPAVIVYS